MANTGASLVIIGGALGHKDSASTQIYARLATDPIKGAMEIASDAMMKAAKPDPAAQNDSMFTKDIQRWFEAVQGEVTSSSKVDHKLMKIT